MGGGAFVVFFFSFCQGKLDLYEVSLSIDPKRNECQAACPDFSDEAFRFTFLDEKLARSGGVGMRRVAGKGVEGDERIGEYEVVAMNGHKTPPETHVSGFD